MSVIIAASSDAVAALLCEQIYTVYVRKRARYLLFLFFFSFLFVIIMTPVEMFMLDVYAS